MHRVERGYSERQGEETILSIATTIWLVSAAWEIVEGILQILAGIVTCPLALAIYFMIGVP